jgi:probable HAF family extracellular repeat protein
MNWIRLILIPAAAGIATAGSLFTLTDLGNLGGTSAAGFGVNATGQTAGTATTYFGYAHAFSSNGSGMTDLTLNSTAWQGFAAGINDGGQVVGTQYIGGDSYATIWNNGAASAVGGAGSFGTSINNSGDVAGMLIQNGQGNAFVTRNGTVFNLGTFDGGIWSSAYSLNDSGAAAGYGLTSAGNFRGFIWTQSQGYVAVGTLGGGNSYALSINASGEAAGAAQTASGYLRAITSSGGIVNDLGTLGGSMSYAYAINDQGNVVGFSWTSAGEMHGFIYMNGRMIDINDLLIGAPGWTITALYGINSSNQVVGTGIYNGVEHAVLLTDPPSPAGPETSPLDVTTATAPEPAAWVAMLTGLVILILLRRRNANRI